MIKNKSYLRLYNYTSNNDISIIDCLKCKRM